MATEAALEPDIDLAPAEVMIKGYVQETEAVIALLQDIQEHYGYLLREVLDLIADRLELPRTQTYGLATFYRAFALEPQGKHRICVCTGTACHVRGAPAVLDRLQSDLNDIRRIFRDLYDRCGWDQSRDRRDRGIHR